MNDLKKILSEYKAESLEAVSQILKEKIHSGLGYC
jgi:hypothetical protein